MQLNSVQEKCISYVGLDVSVGARATINVPAFDLSATVKVVDMRRPLINDTIHVALFVGDSLNANPTERWLALPLPPLPRTRRRYSAAVSSVLPG